VPAGIRSVHPGIWQNARPGLMLTPRNTGTPTMPSLPTVATSTACPSSITASTESTHPVGK
jgi:hypothetical protein